MKGEAEIEAAAKLLHAYLDEELDAAEAAAFEVRLSASPGLRAELERERALKSALRRQATRFEAPAALRREAERLAAVDAPRLPADPRRREWFRLGAAFAAGVGVAATAFLLFPGVSDPVLDEVIGGHVGALLGNRLTDVASSDQHTVKPWLGTHLDFSPPVQDFAAEGFPLVGARLDYVAHRRVAALVYRYRQHVITVFVWPASGPAPSLTETERGFNAIRFSAAGWLFWIVSDLNVAELSRLVPLLERAEAPPARPS